ncbi:hypothetical protein AVEN_54095-1 [Araneus ventricosus]|uniref:Uncharacterized protein n=1 Tax=Araneus ventricosus TaxID=182803 RepID=A0A4Y2BW24_ARAVE|nr:hypothetical protein AVEN_54095-1 [Araneus ventricosus]
MLKQVYEDEIVLRHIICTSDNVCTNHRKLLKTPPLVQLSIPMSQQLQCSVNLRPFRDNLSLGNRKKSGSDRSEEYGGGRQFNNPMLRQKPLYKRNVTPPCIIGHGEPPTPMLDFDAFAPISKLLKPRVQSLQGHGVISIHLLQHCMTLAC